MAKQQKHTFSAKAKVIYTGPERTSASGVVYKSLGFAMEPPATLRMHFKPHEVKLVGSKWLEPKQEGDPRVIFMTIFGAGKYDATKGYELDLIHKEVFVEYSISIGEYKGKPSPSLIVKKVELVKEGEEDV